MGRGLGGGVISGGEVILDCGDVFGGGVISSVRDILVAESFWAMETYKGGEDVFGSGVILGSGYILVAESSCVIKTFPWRRRFGWQGRFG